MHEFAEDFYGATLEVCVAGYIRPEKQFVSIGEQKGACGYWRALAVSLTTKVQVGLPTPAVGGTVSTPVST